MQHVETICLSTLPFPVKMYCRYVDDTFVIVEKHNLQAMHDALNSVHPAIQFTCEMEDGDTLAFLDVLVRRNEGGSLATSVYRKPCDSGNVLSFDSHHPAEHKYAVARTLLSRCDALSSTQTLRKHEETNVATVLNKRSYPQRFVDDTRRRMQRPRESRANNENSVVCIPYVCGVSEAVRRALRPLGVRTVFKPMRTLANVFPKPKDRTPSDEQSGVVYKVNCTDCDACYIGETGRRRHTRIKEHVRDVTKATHSTRAKTELVDHCLTKGHVFDFDNVTTLAREQRWGPRKFIESWFIRHNQNACNSNRGPLPDVYGKI